MHAERLERLAVLLETDAANPEGARFDLGSWASPTEGSKMGEHHAMWAEKPTEVKVDCGTSACAMGLAALSGEFAKEGLSYTFLGNHGDYMLCPSFRIRDGYQETGFETAVYLFGIDIDDAQYLFDPDNYDRCHHKGANAERFVAQRIRDFIRGEIDKSQHPSTRYEDEDVDVED